MTSRLFLVRRTPAHACVAHVTWTGSAFRLIRVTPDAGELPDISGIAGTEFQSRAELRAAIKNLMRTNHGNTQSDPT